MTASASTATSRSFVDQLAAIPDVEERKKVLTARKRELDLNMIVDLANQAREFLRVDARRSLNLGELAIEIAGIIGNQLAVAHAIRIKANALHGLGQYASAVELHSQAIRLFEAEGETEELGRTLSASILSLNLCGDYDAALSAAGG